MKKGILSIIIILLFGVVFLFALTACQKDEPPEPQPTAYTITFNSNGGSAVAAITKEAGEPVTAPAAPTRDGYVFEGWFSDSELTIPYTFTVMPGENITLYVKWGTEPQPVTYTVTFNSNGGSAVAAITKEAGEPVTAPAAPTRDGYVFEGWFSDSGLTIPYTFTVMPQENITLYAKWAEEPRPAYKRVDVLGNPDENGEYILFGEYPQTIKAADVTVTETRDGRGYYLGSDGSYYVKITADTYNPVFKFTNNDTIVSGETYYFKVEPLKWRILEESGGKALLLCENIIVSARFDADFNNYRESEIRTLLNGAFLEAAFGTEQADIIETVTVDNGSYSTGYTDNEYACPDTSDKVFALSYREVVNTQYGFFAGKTINDTKRRHFVTDFARATGALINEYGFGWWWLRSPDYDDDDYAGIVDQDGKADLTKPVSDSRPGIVPALKIRLSDEG